MLRVKQNEEIGICSKWKTKIKPQKINLSEIEISNLVKKRYGQKDAHQSWEKNGWTQNLNKKKMQESTKQKSETWKI